MYQRKGTLKLTNERLLELGKITGCMDFQIKLLRDKIEDMTVEVEENWMQTTIYLLWYNSILSPTRFSKLHYIPTYGLPNKTS